VSEVSLFFCYLLRCKVQVQKVKKSPSVFCSKHLDLLIGRFFFFQSGELAEVMGGINFYFLTPGLFTSEIRPSKKNVNRYFTHLRLMHISTFTILIHLPTVLRVKLTLAYVSVGFTSMDTSFSLAFNTRFTSDTFSETLRTTSKISITSYFREHRHRLFVDIGTKYCISKVYYIHVTNNYYFIIFLLYDPKEL